MPGHVISPFGMGPGGAFGGGEFGGNLVGPRNPGFGGWPGMGGPSGPLGGGVRFDPIGPPGLLPPGGLGGPRQPRFPMGGDGGPDNDLFRPPTGRDDMFM